MSGYANRWKAFQAAKLPSSFRPGVFRVKTTNKLNFVLLSASEVKFHHPPYRLKQQRPENICVNINHLGFTRKLTRTISMSRELEVDLEL